MSNRRSLRESVLKAVYAHHQGGGDAAHILKTILVPETKEDKEGLKFAENLFLKTIRSSEDFDTIISPNLKNWDLNRIALVDRLVLHIAICEFLYFDDIPTKVTINEAIEIAKKFSTGNSGKFVNGLLDVIRDNLKEQGRFNKTGRGLVD
ncbi:MAG: transcription antitermination factor NusB [Bacteroidetes bacterium]|nr:transcription antitermination factor NusB [Bacteroidota bacterium]MCH8523246.1 transcription antitermination factor NusB [Balneolales bacterium]